MVDVSGKYGSCGNAPVMYSRSILGCGWARGDYFLS